MSWRDDQETESEKGEWLKTQWRPDNVTAGTNGRKYTQNQIWLSAVSQGHRKWCVSGELWRCSRFTAQPITHFLNMQGPLPPPSSCKPRGRCSPPCILPTAVQRGRFKKKKKKLCCVQVACRQNFTCSWPSQHHVSVFPPFCWLFSGQNRPTRLSFFQVSSAWNDAEGRSWLGKKRWRITAVFVVYICVC